MASFLQRMTWRGGDNDRQSDTISETQHFAEGEDKKLTTATVDWPENRRESGSNISEETAGSRRPSTLRLFGSSRKPLPDVASCQSSSAQDSKAQSSSLVEDVVREFEESYMSPTETSSKKPKNFVKKIVAALERRQRDNEVDEVYAVRNHSGPIYAHEKYNIIKKYESSCRDKIPDEDPSDEVKNANEKTNAKAQVAASTKTMPKIIGAFLKKPVEVDETSIYWIPITGKKLPRKKSFKKLLARLTGRNGEKDYDTNSKQVVFASQTNLAEEIHDSGYEGTSSRCSSLKSFTETLMYNNECYVDKAYKDCTFSTFAKSSQLKKPEISHPILVDKSKDLSKLVPEKEVTPEIVEIPEDLEYIFNASIFDESMPRKSLVATRIEDINYQLTKLPKHPFARSEPRLYQQNNGESSASEGIVTLRKSNDEPIYDIPHARPRSDIVDESVSMMKRNVPIQTVPPYSESEYPIFWNVDDDEQPYYSTVNPVNSKSRISCDSLLPYLTETTEKFVEGPIGPKKALHSSYIDLTANQSFVISMYV